MSQIQERTGKHSLEVTLTTLATFSCSDIVNFDLRLGLKHLSIDSVKSNKHTEYLSKRSPRWKVIVRTHRHTSNRLPDWTSKMVS